MHACATHTELQLTTLTNHTNTLTYTQGQTLTLYLYTTTKNFVAFATPTFWVVLYIVWPLWKFTHLEHVLNISLLETCILNCRTYDINIYYCI